MTAPGLVQIAVYGALLVLLGIPLGLYMARVYRGEARLAGRVLGPIERVLYRIAGVDPAAEMTWRRYAIAVLLFNLVGALVVYALQRLQHVLPGNPNDLAAVDPRVAFNTAI